MEQGHTEIITVAYNKLGKKLYNLLSRAGESVHMAELSRLQGKSNNAQRSGEVLAGKIFLEISVKRKDLLLGINTHAGLSVLTDSLLEEVCLSLERNHVHPVERVQDLVDLVGA